VGRALTGILSILSCAYPLTAAMHIPQTTRYLHCCSKHLNNLTMLAESVLNNLLRVGKYKISETESIVNKLPN
jgi:hypothetical protein